MKKSYLIGAVVALSAAFMLAAPMTTDAKKQSNNNSSNCKVTTEQPGFGTQMVDPVGGPKKFTKSGGKANIKVSVTGNNCKETVTLAAWKAPNADFKPYKKQELVSSDTQVIKSGKSLLMNIQIPNCYFQIDLVHGKNPRGIDGGGAYEEGRMIHSIKGGNKSCNPPKETPKKIWVCDLASKTMIQIDEKAFDASKHSTNQADCVEAPGELIVCELETGNVIKIKEGEFDATKHSKDLSDCDETPVETPKELPQTGIESVLNIVGASALTGSTGYWLSSRRRF